MTGKTTAKRGRTAGGRPPHHPGPAKTTKARTRPANKKKIATTRSRWGLAVIGVVAVLAIGGLYAIYRNATGGSSGGASSSGLAFQAGRPGPGATAPAFTLASSTGGQLDLASLRGKSVLLYFQEGLSCQPCWDQIADLEKQSADVKAAGVDQVVSVTTDPVDLITRKTSDMKLSTPVLSDPDLAVSKQYDANSYGMMGTSRDGHTFILVDKEGVIRWRADYGGAPKYTMFVPVDGLLKDLRAGTQAATQ